MEILISFLFSCAIILESYGSVFRAIGAVNSKAASGYSMHVRIATIGRLFVIFVAPTLGYLVDSGKNFHIILYIALWAYIFLALIHLLFIYFFKNILNLSGQIVGWPLPVNSFFKKHLNMPFIIIVSSIFAISIQSSGVFAVNSLATIFPDNKSVLLQFAGAITMFGTALHTFLVDPWLSKKCDESVTSLNAIFSYILARFVGIIINLLIVGILLYVS